MRCASIFICVIALQYIKVCVCVCMCALQRRVTLAGRAGVTCPLRSNTLKMACDTQQKVCVKGGDSPSPPCALELLSNNFSSESNSEKDSNALLITSHVPLTAWPQ